MTRIEGKVAIITGSSSGIGKGIALTFAQKGAMVVTTSRSLDRAQQVSKEIETAGGVAFPCSFDLESPESAKKLLTAAKKYYGKVDILVNNALSRSTISPSLFQDMTWAQMNAAITANLTNSLTLTAQAYSYLRESGGVVLSMGSAVVNKHMTGIALYTIIKGAISQMTKALAAEWAADGIRVNQINPGFVATDSLSEQLPEETMQKLKDQFLQHHPLGRVGVIEDISGLALYMVSDYASWMTGAIIDMDGGYSVKGVVFPKVD